MHLPHIVIGKGDVERLYSVLLHGLKCEVAHNLLCRELDRALVLEDWLVSPKVVKMGSTVLFRHEDNNERRVAKIVLPDEEPYYVEAVSIETALGVTLLGLSEGQSMSYLTSGGRVRKVLVLSVLGSMSPGFAPPEAAHMRLSSRFRDVGESPTALAPFDCEVPIKA